MAEHGPRGFGTTIDVCDYCGKAYRMKGMASHRRSCLKRGQHRVYPCPGCSKPMIHHVLHGNLWCLDCAIEVSRADLVCAGCASVQRPRTVTPRTEGTS